MDVGSDTFPRDEVTGLAAFDDLDPVSTVSTLNVMPEAAPAPRIFTPPPPPNSVVSSVLAQGPRSAPPPLARASRTFSRPPEVPPTTARPSFAPVRGSLPPSAAVPAELRRADATDVLDIPASADTGSFESWEEPDEAATQVAMRDGNPPHSAELQMDWDEDEPPTQMRGEDGFSTPRPMMEYEDDVSGMRADVGPTSAYQPAPESGRPSPFPSARPSLPPSATSLRASAPSPFVVTETEASWGDELRDDRRAYWLIGLGAFAIVALGFALRSFFAAPTPGLVTIAISPSDARVSIDGKPVSGTASPFSAPDLAPGVSHELLVQKDGFVEQRSTFTLGEGETKTLPDMKLAAVAHDTGFAVSSDPAGAAIRIDGQDTGKVTPARLLQIDSGMHKLELVHDGYANYEVEVLVPQNQVLELPSVALVAGRGAARPSAPSAASAASSSEPSTSHRSHHHHSSSAVSAPAPRPTRAAPAPRPARVKAAPKPKRAVLKAAAPVAGKGILRINSRPWAQVFVDGKLMGNTPQMGLQLSPGDHKLKLVNGPMGLSKTVSINVKAGQTVTKVLNLAE